jgi:hypothetical protein
MLDASAPSASVSVSMRIPTAPVASEGGPSTQEEPSLRRQSTDPARWAPGAAPEIASRFAERSVALPVTPLSDGRPREESPHTVSGDRPVVQVLTLGLLIAMIVLVSAAVGVLVGRWMSQR